MKMNLFTDNDDHDNRLRRIMAYEVTKESIRRNILMSHDTNPGNYLLSVGGNAKEFRKARNKKWKC